MIQVRSAGARLAWLKAKLAEAHLPGLFSALRGMVADLVVGAFAWVGPVLGREAKARIFAEEMLNGSPLIPGTDNFFVVEYDSGPIPTRVRNACCLSYRVDDATCLTYPRNTDEERLLRLAAGQGDGGHRTVSKLQAEEVTLGYDGPDIVKDLSIEIPPVRLTCIAGSNACGKSTLLRAPARLIKPKGAVYLNGTAIHELLGQAFSVEADVVPDPCIGATLCIPYGLRRRGGEVSRASD